MSRFASSEEFTKIILKGIGRKNLYYHLKKKAERGFQLPHKLRCRFPSKHNSSIKASVSSAKTGAACPANV